MKKIIAAFALGLVTLTAQADPGWNRGHHSYYRGPGYGYNGWVAPFVTGAVIGGAIAYAATPRYYPVPVVPVVPATPLPPPGYQYQSVLDANCNCYRTVLVPIY